MGPHSQMKLELLLLRNPSGGLATLVLAAGSRLLHPISPCFLQWTCTQTSVAQQLFVQPCPLVPTDPTHQVGQLVTGSQPQWASVAALVAPSDPTPTHLTRTVHLPQLIVALIKIVGAVRRAALSPQPSGSRRLPVRSSLSTGEPCTGRLWQHLRLRA